MRVHGTLVVRRRDNVEAKSDYKDYQEILSEDFSNICGYCGKSQDATTKGFEPDHFVPDRIDKTRKTDYYNLVNCCFTCNRKKLGKWPTEDKTLSHNGIVGLVDPAVDEYDKHLERSSDGNIIGKTDVGKYLCEKIFKFDIRPMKEIWKYMQILDRQKILEASKDNLSYCELISYLEINKILKELHTYLFSKKE